MSQKNSIKKRQKANHSTQPDGRPKEIMQHNWGKIIELLDKTEVLSIERFLLNIGIIERVYYDAVSRLPDLKEAHERALMKMGVKREEMCIENKLGMSSVVAYSLPQFLKRWKLDAEWRAHVKDNAQGVSEEKIKAALKEVMEPFESKD